MAQIIKHRRGSIGNLKDVTARKGEIVMTTGSIGDLSGPFLGLGEIEGVAGAYKPVSKIYQGATVPTIDVGSFGSVLDGTPFYSTTGNTLYILSQAGNTNMDLTGNINGNTISDVTITDLTSTNITGTTLTITGDATIDGNLIIGGNITIGDETTDSITINADFASDLLPDSGNTYNIGSTGKTWNELYLEGLTYDGSSLVVTGLTNTLGNFELNDNNLIIDTELIGSPTNYYRNFVNIQNTSGLTLPSTNFYNNIIVGSEINVLAGSTLINSMIFGTNIEINRPTGGPGWAVAFGENHILGSGVSGTASFTLTAGLANLNGGYGTTALGIGSRVLGTGAGTGGGFAVGLFSDGSGDYTGQYPRITAGARGFNVSRNTAVQTDGYGALGGESAILGGLNHHIPADADRSVILGGDQIVAATGVTNTVYVPKLRIGQGNSATITTSTGTENLLAIDSNGEVIQIAQENAITIPDTQVVFGTGIGVDSSANLTFSTGSNTLDLDGNLIVRGDFTVLGGLNEVIISSSIVEIDDNILRLNAFSPFQRYAGIEVIDSGSNGLLSASLQWDSQDDYWMLVSEDGESSRMVGTTFGSFGSESSLSVNTIPKATSGSTIGNSLLTDNGTTLSYNSNFTVTASNGNTTIAGTLTLSNAGGADAGTKTSEVIFKNSTNVIGYVSTTEVAAELDSVLGYRTSDGSLVMSTIIDGGIF